MKFRIISSIILVVVLAALAAWKMHNEDEQPTQPPTPTNVQIQQPNNSQFNLR